MKITSKMRIAMMAIIAVLACTEANAQHWRWQYRPSHVVTVISKPAVAVHINNRFTQKERFRMAVAYLKNHEYLTVKKYAKMTELSKEAAKAELEAFADDKDRPIVAVMRGKKRVYALRHRN